MGFDAHQRSEYASLIILGFIAFSAVGLRFLARSRSKASVGYDDWLILAGLVFYLVYVTLTLWGQYLFAVSIAIKRPLK